MRYIAIAGGLGNQMFQYAYYLFLRTKFPDVKMFFPTNEWEHSGGFELGRVFKISHKPSLWEKLYHIGFPFTRLFHALHEKYSGTNFKINALDFTPPQNCKYFYGTWQSEKYLYSHDIIRNAFKFSTELLSDETRRIGEIIKGRTTVSVHIRRGDYLSASFANGFGNCCPLDYYQRAIAMISKTVDKPLFVFFSDDMEWVKENFAGEDCLFVSHNKGVDSWQDMYLMSLCNHNIIANSTFSWWGAWLNHHEDKMVIAPKKWWSTIENDDVVPETWMRI